jgi:hypothetical protein
MYGNRNFYIKNSRFNEVNCMPLTDNNALKGLYLKNSDIVAWAFSENSGCDGDGSDYTLVFLRSDINKAWFTAHHHNYILEYVSGNLLDVKTYNGTFPNGHIPNIANFDGTSIDDEMLIYIR